MTGRACPVCGSFVFRQAIDASAIEAEFDAQAEFIHTRLRRRASRPELKDLVDFMHGDPAALLECTGCGLLLRDEPAPRATADYEEDPNDPDLMAQVYPKYVQAFQQKAAAYRDRLRPHAPVLELGSHLGGFLEAAETWNWHPIGLDIGRDTSEFVRRRGLTVRRETIEDARLPFGHFDAVFVWNCFEQLADPASTLGEVRRVLRKHGLLVLRVPNALPYRLLRRAAKRPGAARSVLASNNLLGFPYLFGYTEQNLARLLASAGFRHVESLNSELVTLPFPDDRRALAGEQRAISRTAAGWSSEMTRRRGAAAGPWLEVIFRKTEEIPARIPAVFRRNINLFLPRAA